MLDNLCNTVITNNQQAFYIYVTYCVYFHVLVTCKNWNAITPHCICGIVTNITVKRGSHCCITITSDFYQHIQIYYSVKPNALWWPHK